MKKLHGKRFVASFSGGKDSVHAVYRAIKAGMEPVGLITMYNTDEQRSWFHGISENLLERAADSMSIPLFSKPVSLDVREKVILGKYSALDIS